MLLFALVLGLFFVSGQTLFNVGGSTPTTGLGTVLQAPPSTKPTAPNGSARLMIKQIGPVLVVAGSGFKSGERVRVTGPRTAQTTASSRGSFELRLRNVNACNGFTIVATGSKGSRTSLNFSQLLCVED